MLIKWTSKASSDLARLYEFLAVVNKSAAIKAVQALVKAAENLHKHPRMGVRLEEFMPQEVRRVLAGNYEMRYEIKDDVLYIIRLWHTRENRH